MNKWNSSKKNAFGVSVLALHKEMPICLEYLSQMKLYTIYIVAY